MLARYEHRQKPSDPVSVWLECDGLARIILDGHLGIHWVNSAALQTIRDTDIFEIRDGKLLMREHRRGADFEAFIRSAGLTESLLCVPQASGSHVLCTARGLNPGALERSVGLTLRYTARSLLFDGTALEKAFHLTSTERRVVEALFSGRTAEQVGGDFRISTGTVRAHIRHIYDKLSVASREALFHKALPFFAPL